MNRNEIRAYCLSKPAAVEDFPFGDDSPAVFKVMGKMFALLPLDGSGISLKCDPAWATVLRQTYPGVTAGYHLNKKHWNSVRLDGSIPDDEIRDMVDHSLQQVVKGLTRKQREELPRYSG
jgi:predicted DNA-binding protein (MmcQ/YjbR family)